MPSVEGLGARRAALQMLDGVLRRGLTLDAAATHVRNLSPPDRALSVAIAGEVLRRMPDLDALIDGATRQRLPDDSKARMVLRIALAQKIGLGTPEHALVSTALPLVDGGPRRLVHGVLGTLLRRGVPSMDAPHLPLGVEERWNGSWGDEVVRTARRQIARRPSLDLTFADDSEAQQYAKDGGVSLAPRHVRLQSSSVAALPGFDEGRWWVQDLAASLPARLIPRKCTRRARPLRRAGGQDDAARRCRPLGHGGRIPRKVVSDDFARISIERTSMRRLLRRMPSAGSRTRSSTQFCLTPRARQRAPFADIPRSSTARVRKLSRAPASFSASSSIGRSNGSSPKDRSSTRSVRSSRRKASASLPTSSLEIPSCKAIR